MYKTHSKQSLLFTTLVSIEVAFLILLAISLREYIYPATFAIILVYISIPAIALLERKCRLPRVFAVGLIFLCQLIIVCLILLKGLPFIFIEVTSLLKKLPSHVGELLSNINTTAAQYGINLNMENSLLEQKVSEFFKNLASLDINALRRTVAFAQGTASQLILSFTWIINLLLIPILYFFIGIHYDEILLCIEKYTPKKYRSQVSNLLQEVSHIMSSFLRGELLLISSLAICYTIGFNLVGVPYATALGILTGLLSFIPFLGSLTGMTIAVFSLYSVQGSIYSLLSLGAVYLITGTLESLILIPYLIGNSLGMSTFTSLIVLIIATKELGAIGLILGIPIAAILKHLFLSFAEVCQANKVI